MAGCARDREVCPRQWVAARGVIVDGIAGGAEGVQVVASVAVTAARGRPEGAEVHVAVAVGAAGEGWGGPLAPSLMATLAGDAAVGAAKGVAGQIMIETGGSLETKAVGVVTACTIPNEASRMGIAMAIRTARGSAGVADDRRAASGRCLAAMAKLAARFRVAPAQGIRGTLVVEARSRLPPRQIVAVGAQPLAKLLSVGIVVTAPAGGR